MGNSITIETRADNTKHVDVAGCGLCGVDVPDFLAWPLTVEEKVNAATIAFRVCPACVAKHGTGRNASARIKDALMAHLPAITRSAPVTRIDSR
jgi:hypothetical protein